MPLHFSPIPRPERFLLAALLRPGDSNRDILKRAFLKPSETIALSRHEMVNDLFSCRVGFGQWITHQGVPDRSGLLANKLSVLRLHVDHSIPKIPQSIESTPELATFRKPNTECPW